MARYDKYEPYGGGFRAPLAADFGTLTNGADLGKIWAVSLDANGRIVKTNATAGQTAVDCVGLLIVTVEKYAGNVVDVMTDGEIVDISDTDNAGVMTAGSKYFADAGNNGAIAKIAAPVVGTNYTVVGRTVEKTRLVVRLRGFQG